MDVIDIMMAKAISGGGGGGTGGGDVFVVPVTMDISGGQPTFSTDVAVADVIAADAANKAVLYIMKMLPQNNNIYALSYGITAEDSEVAIDFDVTSLIHDADGIHEDSGGSPA